MPGPPHLFPTHAVAELQIEYKYVLYPQHSALNDIIKRALSSAGFNDVLPPVGHDCGDGKRPDDMTVSPFSRKTCLIWYSTCFNSSPSALVLTKVEPGSAPHSAEERRNPKYEGLSTFLM